MDILLTWSAVFLNFEKLQNLDLNPIFQRVLPDGRIVCINRYLAVSHPYEIEIGIGDEGQSIPGLSLPYKTLEEAQEDLDIWIKKQNGHW